MMNEENLINLIVNLLEEEGDPREVNLSSDFVEDLGFDSLRYILLITSIEEEFNIEITESDFVGIATVNDIILKFNEMKG